MKTRWAVIMAFLLWLPAPMAAQLTPDQALNRRQISDLHFSPDGRDVAFTVGEPPKNEGPRRHIWMLDISSHRVFQYTDSAKSEFSPRWSPDGRSLAFLSDREEASQIYLIPTDGGEAVRLTEGKNSIRSLEWSPDGTQIAFIAPDSKTEAEEKKAKEKDDAHRVDRDDKQPRLWLVDVKSKKVRALTPDTWAVSEMQWFPRGNVIIVSATDHPDSDKNTRRIFSVAVLDGSMKEISAPRGPFGGLQISPDGRSVAYLASRLDGPTPHDLFLQPLDGGAARNLTGKNLDRMIAHFLWRNDGSFLAVAENGFTDDFYSISPAGTVARLPRCDPHPGFAFDAQGDDVAFVGESTTHAPEIYLARLGAAPVQQTHVNEAGEKIPVIAPEIFKYKSFDGTEIEAALLKPPGYREGTKAPLVVLIHGGPTGRWSDRFESWGQLLAARGFAVFYPNIRGSTGYGFRFLEMNRGDWGGADFKDVMAGVDYLIKKGIADPDRLGIGGWSYGGYMAEWAITQTHRFKAAVCGAGLSDLVSEFGTEHGPAYDRWFYGVPYEKLEGFLKSSLIKYLKNARTPTLILQGDADVTDPIGQSQELYRGLKHYGVDSDFVLYPREGHGFREEKHLLDRLNRIMAWYEKYLGPQ